MKILIRLHPPLLVILISLFVLSSAPAQDGPRVIRKQENAIRESAIRRVEPVYPQSAKAAGISGTVVVEVVINVRGQVASARALQGHELLKDAAATAARQWFFQPPTQNGVAVQVIGSLTFNFRNDQPDPTQTDKQKEEAAEAEEWIQEAREDLARDPNSIQARRDLAEALVDAKRFDEAIDVYNDALRLKPNDERLFLELAQLYLTLERFDEAVATYNRALEVMPKSEQMLVGLVGVLSSRKRYVEAAEIQKRIVDLKPADPSAQYNLGFYLFAAGKFEDAIAPYEAALRLKPGNGGALHNLGAIYLNLKRFAEALESYQQILQLEPPYSGLNKVYREMAMTLLALRRPGEAIDAAKKALAIDPSLNDTYLTLAGAYAQSGMLNDAAETLLSGLALRPEDRSLRGSLGETYRRMGNLPEAERVFRELTRTDADYAYGYMGLAMVLTEQKKYDQAEALLQKASQLAPRDISPRLFLAQLLSTQQKYNEAEAAYRQVLKLAPDNPLVLNNFGYSLAERGVKLEEALEMIQRAVDAAPTNGGYLDSLGWAYFKMGRLEKAERYLNDAVNAGAQSATIYEHLGEVYEKLDKPDEARAARVKALSLAKDADQIARLKSKLDPNTNSPEKRAPEKKEPEKKEPDNKKPNR